MGRFRQSGLSLVELMVSITVGLLLVVVMATLLANSSRSHRELSNSAQQIDNGSYAMGQVAEDIRHAGYYGEFHDVPAPAAALPDPCETANLAVLAAAIAFPVQGYDAPGASPVACIDDADFVAGTDVLVIRRASTVVTPIGSLAANGVYMQGVAGDDISPNPIVNYGVDPSVFTLTKKDGVTTADVRRYITTIYFVSPCDTPAPGLANCTAAADGGNPVPTLKRLDLDVDPATGNRGMVLTSVAQGIEQIGFDYGVDTDNDGSPNGAMLAAPATVADWASVVTVRVHALARNPQRSAGYVDAKTYNLGTAGAFAPGGAFKRHVFAQLVRVNNVSERRETP